MNNINKDIETILINNEKVLWKGKPDLLTFTRHKNFNNGIFCILVFFIGISILFLIPSIRFIILGKSASAIINLIYSIAWFLPVIAIFTNNKKVYNTWKSTEYIITDKRFIAKSLSVIDGVQFINKEDVIKIQMEKFYSKKDITYGNITFYTLENDALTFDSLKNVDKLLEEIKKYK